MVDRLNADLDRKGDPLVSIIKAQDDLWDVSLMKFIYELTRNSLSDNMQEMNARGLLNMDGAGIPADARMKIEELFSRWLEPARVSSRRNSTAGVSGKSIRTGSCRCSAKGSLIKYRG